MDFVRMAATLVVGAGGEQGGVLEKVQKGPGQRSVSTVAVSSDDARELGQAGFVCEQVLGQGSVARVYRCEHRSGRTVAVKVLRRGIKKKIESDIRGILSIAALARTVNPSAANMFVEGGQLLEREADMYRELRYGLRVADAAKKAEAMVHIPTYIPELCTSSRLVYDYIDASPLDTVDPKDLPPLVSAGVVDVYSALMVGFGLCQCDVNTGNFLWNQDSQKLTMIDMGGVVTLTPAVTKIVQEIHCTAGDTAGIRAIVKHDAVADLICVQHRMLWAKKPVRFVAPMFSSTLITFDMQDTFGFVSRGALVLSQTLVHLNHFVSFFDVMDKNRRLITT